jgi:hypothetical protein
MGKETRKPKYRCLHCGSYEVKEFTEEGIELTEEVRGVIKKEDGVKIRNFKCSLCGYKWDKCSSEYSVSGVGAAAMSGAPLFLGVIIDVLKEGIMEGVKALRRWKYRKR